jgi:uncharacterized membrane protein
MNPNLESSFFSSIIFFAGILVFAAMLFYIFPPKRINYLYGYRTPSAMKSPERWQFAQRYSAIAMLKCGLLLGAISVVGLFYSYSEKVDRIAAFVIIFVVVVLLFMRIEGEIKKLP